MPNKPPPKKGNPSASKTPTTNRGTRGQESQAKRDEKQENYRERRNVETDDIITQGIREKMNIHSPEMAILSKMQTSDDSYLDSREKGSVLLVATCELARIIKNILRQHVRLVINKQQREHDFVQQQMAWIAVTVLQLSYKFFELHRQNNTNGRIAYQMTSEDKQLVAGNRANLSPIVEFIDSIGVINIGGQRLIPAPWATSPLTMNFTMETLRRHLAPMNAEVVAELAESCFHGIEVWNPHAGAGDWEMAHPHLLANINHQVVPLYYKFISAMQSATGYSIDDINWNVCGCESLLPTYDYRPSAQLGDTEIWHQEKVNLVCQLKGTIMGFGMLPPECQKYGMPAAKRRKLGTSAGLDDAAAEVDQDGYDPQDSTHALPWRLPHHRNVRYSSRTRHDIARDKWLHARKTGLV